ncbi:hypothetical protein N658DRAFT_241257 [Parathielavia hyrcaniae]|uniref:Uncharacterized protein n=1 Tax=Parathielavia hyrcaniae TaxID=113614 RepID=A0AAN6Q5S6_9PEZI|nr:hypothetical protein N658DRAFT_241257 [Parathielavia hyrcaniae]
MLFGAIGHTRASQLHHRRSSTRCNSPDIHEKVFQLGYTGLSEASIWSGTTHTRSPSAPSCLPDRHDVHGFDTRAVIWPSPIFHLSRHPKPVDHSPGSGLAVFRTSPRCCMIHGARSSSQLTTIRLLGAVRRPAQLEKLPPCTLFGL